MIDSIGPEEPGM
jgi:hypothetical protein